MSSARPLAIRPIESRDFISADAPRFRYYKEMTLVSVVSDYVSKLVGIGLQYWLLPKASFNNPVLESQ